MLSGAYLLLVPEVVSLAEDAVSLSDTSSFTSSIVLLQLKLSHLISAWYNCAIGDKYIIPYCYTELPVLITKLIFPPHPTSSLLIFNYDTDFP